MSVPAYENPEIMGRSEPHEPHVSSAMTIWPDMTDFQRRFEEIQSDLIEDPRGAVREAERLMGRRSSAGRSPCVSTCSRCIATPVTTRTPSSCA